MLLTVLFVFIAVFLLVLAIYLNISAVAASPKAELKRRLRQVALTEGRSAGGLSESLRSEILKETPPLERLLTRFDPIRKLDGRLDRSGVNITLARFLGITGAIGLAGFLISFVLSHNLILGLLAGVALMVIPFAYIEFRKRQREEKFTEVLPDALTMISRSIRSGHSFTSAIELVGNEVPEPVGSLFKTAYEQQQLGLRINDTLNNLNNRIDSIDLRFFTTAVAINSEVGGNFAEILDQLADTIRQRLKIKRQLRIHTAQGRMTGYILAVLPIVVFFLMNIVIPGYQKTLLNNDTGRIVLVIAVIMQLIGFLVIRRIINIRI